MSAWGCSFLFFNARSWAFTQPVYNNISSKTVIFFVLVAVGGPPLATLTAL